MVYATEVKSAKGGKTRKLTLRVSGMLWNRSLVMEDTQTESLWSHILGECMRGELKETRLEIMPSKMMTWEKWYAQHPDTSVMRLSRTVENYTREFYRKQMQRFVIGAVLGDAVKAYSFVLLQNESVIQDSIGSTPVLVTFDSESTRASLFDRRVRGAGIIQRTIDFEFDAKTGRLRDRKTDSDWDPSTGKATSGPLAGTQLKLLPGIVSFDKAWRTFHPDSAFYKGTRQK